MNLCGHNLDSSFPLWNPKGQIVPLVRPVYPLGLESLTEIGGIGVVPQDGAEVREEPRFSASRGLTTLGLWCFSTAGNLGSSVLRPPVPGGGPASIVPMRGFPMNDSPQACPLDAIDRLHQRVNQLRFLVKASNALALYNYQTGIPKDAEDEAWASIELAEELLADLKGAADQLWDSTKTQNQTTQPQPKEKP